MTTFYLELYVLTILGITLTMEFLTHDECKGTAPDKHTIVLWVQSPPLENIKLLPKLLKLNYKTKFPERFQLGYEGQYKMQFNK